MQSTAQADAVSACVLRAQGSTSQGSALVALPAGRGRTLSFHAAGALAVGRRFALSRPSQDSLSADWPMKLRSSGEFVGLTYRKVGVIMTAVDLPSPV